VEDLEAQARLRHLIATLLADDRRSWQLGPDAVWRRTEDLRATAGSVDTFEVMKDAAMAAFTVAAQPHRPGVGAGSLDPRA
jgi:hypothetical protein